MKLSFGSEAKNGALTFFYRCPEKLFACELFSFPLLNQRMQSAAAKIRERKIGIKSGSFSGMPIIMYFFRPLAEGDLPSIMQA